MSDKNTLGPSRYLPPTNAANIGRVRQFRDMCGKCGARRRDPQIGLEPTPEAYVTTIVDVFREVWRVLKDDGTAWLNLGDTFNSSPSNQHSAVVGANGSKALGFSVGRQRREVDGLKPKDLCGVPWRVAFALQAAGWYLRSDIIWHKRAPMPESVTDRPTRSHEYVFLLSKRPSYYYDAEAIKEPNAEPSGNGGWQSAIRQGDPDRYQGRYTSNKIEGGAGGSKFLRGERVLMCGRNKRSVWTLGPQSFDGAHFAVMPEALVEPCILAGSRFGDLVLDPFLGSGTVGVVADRLMRRWVGLDLNYHDLARARTAQRGLREISA